jgi:hypothetical protein
VTVAVLWVLSVFFVAELDTSRRLCAMQLSLGCISLVCVSGDFSWSAPAGAFSHQARWTLKRVPPDVLLWPEAVYRQYPMRNSNTHIFSLPLWLPFLLFALPTAYLWHLDRRRPPGLCARCGYDLSGVTGGVCPECGACSKACSGGACPSYPARDPPSR